MDKDTIGLKLKEKVEEAEWIPCPDYKTKSHGKNWFQKLFLSHDDFTHCIHSHKCENWEYNEKNKGCVAGYYNWHWVKVVD